MIDGDGYIAIYPEGTRVQVVITNSSKEFLEKLRSEIGSGGVYHAPGGRQNFSASTYNYVISKRKDVRKILEGILPHLILKKDKALQALEALGRIGG